MEATITDEDVASVDVNVLVKELDGLGHPLANTPPERVPQIGDPVWYIMEERGVMEPLPATLLRRQLNGSWLLNYQRPGVLVDVTHIEYCGTDWKNCHWCWPGEMPRTDDTGEFPVLSDTDE